MAGALFNKVIEKISWNQYERWAHGALTGANVDKIVDTCSPEFHKFNNLGLASY
jgi:hypothetical protein